MNSWLVPVMQAARTTPHPRFADVPLARDQVSAALLAQGLPATARPEELSPSAWVSLARELRWF